LKGSTVHEKEWRFLFRAKVNKSLHVIPHSELNQGNPVG